MITCSLILADTGVENCFAKRRLLREDDETNDKPSSKLSYTYFASADSLDPERRHKKIRRFPHIRSSRHIIILERV